MWEHIKEIIGDVLGIYLAGVMGWIFINIIIYGEYRPWECRWGACIELGVAIIVIVFLIERFIKDWRQK